MDGARIFITGASGFTGQYLQAELAGREAQIFACPRSVDVTDREALAQALKVANPTHIVHLAGVSFTNLDDPNIYDRVNVGGTKTLLMMAAKYAPELQHITLASSAAIYGRPQATRISETQRPNPTTPYARSKYTMEQLATDYEDLAPILIIRPFNYTGPGHPERFLVPKIVDHFARRAEQITLGNLDITREFSDVRDAAANYANLIAASASGPVNLCTGRGHRIAEILEILRDITGQNINVTSKPEFIRADDIPSVIGDPTRLYALGGQAPRFNLSDTLAAMLNTSGHA